MSFNIQNVPEGRVLGTVGIWWIVLCVAFMGQAASIRAEQTADTIVYNAEIFTSEASQPRASALVIQNGEFIYVGNVGTALNFQGPETKLINANKKLITPGFIDAHSHGVWMGILSPVMIQVYNASSLDDLTQKIQQFAASFPELPFIMALGWKYDYIPGGLPTKEMADAILQDRPLILWSHDGHTGWVNSLALTTMMTANPVAFQYLDPEMKDGEPTGLFFHFYAINPFDFFGWNEMEFDLLDRMAEGVTGVLADALRVGVTTQHDVMIHPSVVPLLKEINDRGAFAKARARCAMFINNYAVQNDWEGVQNDIDYWIQFGRQHSTDHLVMGQSVKLGIDGVSPNHTAFLSKPYVDTLPELNYGVASYTAEEFDRLTGYLDSQHLQICTHAVGDAGISRVVDSYLKLDQENTSWDARHVIEHNSMMNDYDMERIRGRNIYCSMQPAHYYGELASVEALGEFRFRRMHRIGTLQANKIPMGFGTDYPVVPFNPIYNLIVAMTRISCLGMPKPWEKKEKISLEDFVYHYTIGSARTLKWEHEIGTIQIGKKADFVIFDLNSKELVQALSNEPWNVLENLRLVWQTYVDGRLVYEKED